MQGTTMDRSKLQALAAELAKDIKTEADLNALSRELLKLTVETALNAELTDHLGYEKHGDSKLARGNARLNQRFGLFKPASSTRRYFPLAI